jgi:hypothetical protein
VAYEVKADEIHTPLLPHPLLFPPVVIKAFFFTEYRVFGCHRL